MTYVLLPEPLPTSALGCWEPELPAFTHVVGFSGLGHFFLSNRESGEFGVCHPFRKAFKNYGTFGSVAEFEARILKDEGFAEHVLRPGHQAAIARRLGPLAPGEVYIPQPYPFLGGSEEVDTYAKGDFWAFAELVGLCHGYGAGSGPPAQAQGFMNEAVLRELGLSEGILQHLREFKSSSPLGFRVQPAQHWRSSPISQRNIVPLWECGTILTYFDRSSATYRRCSLEDPTTDWCEYRSLQAVLAQLFIELYEDGMPNEELLALAKQVGFHHAERLVAESEDLKGQAYQSWATAFPPGCEA